MLKSAIHVVVEDTTAEWREAALPRPKCGELLLTAVAHTGSEALELCAQTQPDMVVLELPGVDGDEAEAASRAICAQYPHVRVIVVTGHGCDGNSRTGLAIGPAEAAPARPPAAEADGGLAASPVDVIVPPAPAGHAEHLTARELEVLACLAEGLTNLQIAKSLCISRATVKFHVSSILAKLEVPTRAAAVAVGIQQQQLASQLRPVFR